MAKNFNIWANFKINDQATKALKNIGKAGASLSRQLSFIGKNAGTVIGNLGRLTSPFIALGGVATVAGMTAMVKNTASYGDQIANMVERVGWGTKAFQEYAHAARFSDMTTEEFASNLEKMTRNMGMLRAGTGSLLSGLQKVSPVLAEQLKATKTNEEAFELIIKAIQKVDDQTKKPIWPIWRSANPVSNGATGQPRCRRSGGAAQTSAGNGRCAWRGCRQ